MASRRSSWVEQMRQKQQKIQGGSEADPESKNADTDLRRLSEVSAVHDCDDVVPSMRSIYAMIATQGVDEGVSWLLKAAIPEWTVKELETIKMKLCKVGITSCTELEAVLQEKGALNQRLRDKGLKVFGNPTLTRLRAHFDSEREKKRQKVLLEERRRVEEERRRLVQDNERRLSIVPPTDPPGRTLGEGRDATDSSSPIDDTTHCEAIRTAPGEEVLSTASEDDSKGEEEGSSNVVAPVVASSAGFRRGLSSGLSCARSWEWPLTREEKKERISMLDRRVIASYEKELDALEVKLERAKKASQIIDSSAEATPDGSSSEGSCDRDEEF